MASKTLATPLFITLNLLFFITTVRSQGNCITDPVRVGACLIALNTVNITVGDPPVTPCCSLIEGLVDLDAAICLCAVLKANVLGIKLLVPIDLTLLLNNCGRKNPGYNCSFP